MYSIKGEKNESKTSLTSNAMHFSIVSTRRIAQKITTSLRCPHNRKQRRISVDFICIRGFSRNVLFSFHSFFSCCVLFRIYYYNILRVIHDKMDQNKYNLWIRHQYTRNIVNCKMRLATVLTAIFLCSVSWADVSQFRLWPFLISHSLSFFSLTHTKMQPIITSQCLASNILFSS